VGAYNRQPFATPGAYCQLHQGWGMSLTHVQNMAQNAANRLLSALHGLKASKCPDDNRDLNIIKAKLLVYYAVLQGDADKCQSAIDSLKELLREQLEGVMEGKARKVWVFGTDNTYVGDKDDENSRQVADTMMRNLATMEAMCSALKA
jgi:hypothetical protein